MTTTEEKRNLLIKYLTKKGFKKTEYTGVLTLTKDEPDRYSLVSFIGRAAKPANRCYYTQKDQRDDAIKKLLALQEKKTKEKEERKKENNKPHDIKVGDLFVACWGYDQTNVDFYQVVSLVGKCSVKIRPIGCKSLGATSWCSDDVLPLPNEFCGEAETKRVIRGGYIKFASYCYAAKTTPDKKQYRSWGH